MRPIAAATRLTLLRAVLGTAFAATFIASPKLWLSSREYPLLPLLPFLPRVPAPLDGWILGILIGLSIWIALRARRAVIVGFLLLLAASLLIDQSRCTTYVMEYTLLLVVLATGLSGGRGSEDSRAGLDLDERTLDRARIIVVGVYLWAGLHKLNHQYMFSEYPATTWPLLGVLSPFFEIGFALGLLTRRWRSIAILGACAMHGFILVSLITDALWFNAPVLIWNLVMPAVVAILFVGARVEFRDLRARWRGGFAVLLAVVFLVFPIAHVVTDFDAYPAWAIFAGTREVAIVTRDGQDLTAAFYEWSRQQTGGFPYPEERVLQAAFGAYCGGGSGDRSMVLTVHKSPNRWTGVRESRTYTCN